MRLQQRAESASNIGHFKKASEYAAQSISADPGFADAYASLGRAMLGLERFDEAREQIKLAIGLAPYHAWYFKLLATIDYFRGDFSSALSSIEQALRLAPYDSNALNRLGHIRYERQEYELALDAFHQALEASPFNASAFGGLGDVYLKMKLFKKAEHHYRQSLQIEPGKATTLNNLGVCLDRQKKLKEAALAYKAALIADPTMKVAKDNTKSAIGRFISPIGGASILLVYGLFKLLSLCFPDDDSADARYATFFAITIPVLIHYLYVRRKAQRKLQQADPQLMEIYKRLKKDKY